LRETSGSEPRHATGGAARTADLVLDVRDATAPTTYLQQIAAKHLSS
jgi:hypothetical protein